MKTTKPIHSWKYHAGILTFAFLVLISGGLYRRSLIEADDQAQPTVLAALQTEIEQLKNDLKQDELKSISEAVSETAQRIAPSVVAITVDPTSRKQSTAIVTYADYRFAAGLPPMTGSDSPLSVSGLLLDKKGRVVTSAGVVSFGTTYLVIGNDRIQRSARLLGVSQADGLAVLQLDQIGNLPQRLTPYPETAQHVTWTVKLGRKTNGNQLVALDWFSGYAAKTPALSHDIHPGSEFDGGPVVTPAGQVIGLQVPVSGQFQSAILPMERVQAIVQALEASSHRPPKSWIGVELQNLSPEIQDVLKVSTGVLVTDITPDGPAFRAGLRSMDVILAVDQTPVETAPALIAAVQQFPPGSHIKIAVVRLGALKTFEIETAAHEVERFSQTGADQTGQPFRIGFARNQLTNSGAVIESIEPAGRAGATGLRPGDVVVGLNGFSVGTPTDVSRILRSAQTGTPQLWLIRRAGSTLCISHREGVTIQ